MNIKKLLMTTALILSVSVSAAYAADNKKNGTPPPPPPPINGKAQSSDTPPPPPPAKNGHQNNGAPGQNNGTPSENNGNPPANNGGGFVRPVHLIGPELGVTGEQFAKCFEAVNPVEQTGMGDVVEPSAEREQANKAVLLPCLQSINPSITNDLLDSVSNKYRPS